MENIKVKEGGTFEFFFDITEEEWADVVPNEEGYIKAKAKLGKLVYPFEVVVDEANRKISFTVNTTGWKLGEYRADVEIHNNGRSEFYPKVDYITFTVIESIANDSEV